MLLYSNKSQKKSRCDENVGGTLGCVSCATLLFLLQIDVICELCSQRTNQKSFIILRLCPVPRVCLWQSVLIFSILCHTCSSCSSIAFFGFFLIPRYFVSLRSPIKITQQRSLRYSSPRMCTLAFPNHEKKWVFSPFVCRYD